MILQAPKSTACNTNFIIKISATNRTKIDGVEIFRTQDISALVQSVKYL